MILIINKSKKDALGLSDMFYYMGILAFGATPNEALAEISSNYRAVILMNPNTFPNKADYVRRLRSYASIPIFAITDTPDLHDSILFDGTMKNGSYAAKIYKFIINYTEAHETENPGSYKLAGINASADLCSPTYFNRALPFTKTETMILRTLIRNYPKATSAKEILKYAFRPSKAPDISNIRTHISVMNKKYRAITEKNIISLTPGEGYAVLTSKK